MLQQVLFWVSYGLLMIIWWGMIVYWMFPLVDKWLESVTDGDLKSFLCEKYRNPFLNKFGLMEERFGTLRFKEEGGKGFLITLAAILGAVITFISYFIQGMNVLFDKQKGYTLHELTTKLSELISTEFTFPMIVILGLILLNTTLKKLYKFGKKVKPLVDSVNRKGE